MPPLTHPTVTIGAQILSLKTSGLTGYLLDSWGVDTSNLVAAMQKPVGRTALAFQLFAALVAHNFMEVGKPIPLPEYWALKIPVEQQAEVFAAVVSVIFTKKTQPVTEQTPAPTPAAIPDPPPVQ